MYTSTMTSPTAVTNITELAERYGEAWNSQDVDAIVALHTEDSVFHLHVPDSAPVEGREAIRATFAGFVEQLPDINFATRRLRTGEDHWVLESVMSAPGSGIEVDFIDVIAVRDGKVARKDSYLDAVTFQEQTGAAPDAAVAWVEAFTEGWRAPADADAFIEAFDPWLADDIRLVQPGIPTTVGKDAFRDTFVRPMFDLIPDLHGTVESWAAHGDVVFIEIRLAGTLAGTPVEWTSVDKVTLRDGIAVERVANFDPAPLLEAAKANA
jgi:steroid delta-isomerase-like uncharacterized protein